MQSQASVRPAPAAIPGPGESIRSRLRPAFLRRIPAHRVEIAAIVLEPRYSTPRRLRLHDTAAAQSQAARGYLLHRRRSIGASHRASEDNQRPMAYPAREPSAEYIHLRLEDRAVALRTRRL